MNRNILKQKKNTYDALGWIKQITYVSHNDIKNIL